VFANPASILWFKFHAIGATMPNLNEGIIRAFPLSVPSIEEQKAIALLLSSLDDKIDLNRRMNRALDATARTIFQDWFVDYGPTHAKLAGLPTYLPPDLWALFPDRVSPDGRPEGWHPSTLNAIADLNPEAWSERNHPSEVQYVDLANTKWGSIESTEMHSWTAAPSRARRVLRPDRRDGTSRERFVRLY
jgi:type I restriction enzyme, S subunit